MKKFLIVPTLLIAALTTSCASIINGPTQSVALTSQPTGAYVTVNSIQIGTTPIVAELKRGKPNLIVLEKEGYDPFQISTTSELSGVVFLNIITPAFVIGAGVDLITGSAYNVSPSNVNSTLKQVIPLRLPEPDTKTFE